MAGFMQRRMNRRVIAYIKHIANKTGFRRLPEATGNVFVDSDVFNLYAITAKQVYQVVKLDVAAA
jgi:hypothetical protein